MILSGTFGFVQTTPTLVTDFGYPESSAGSAFLVIQCYLMVYGIVMPVVSILMNAFTRRLGADKKVFFAVPVYTETRIFAKTGSEQLKNNDSKRERCPYRYPTEFSADAYSASLGYDLGPPLIAISKTNLGEVNPDWLVSMCHDNHPTLMERIEALDVAKAKGGGGSGKKKKAQ